MSRSGAQPRGPTDGRGRQSPHGEPDEFIRQKALELIETEPDLKYRKKYAGEWRAK